MSKAPNHIPSLDGLRAVSFAIVFLAHAGLDYVIPGGFGVTVFFFLSGFLITTLMRAEFDKSGTVNLKAFYLRRVLRILPPFYLVLTIAVLLTSVGFLAGQLKFGAVAAQFLHYANFWIVRHGYEGQPVGSGVLWSLAVEEHYYALFPLLYLALRRRGVSQRSQARLLWGLCAVILIWRCVLVLHFHVATDRTYLASDTRFDSILFGAALAVFGNPVLDGPPPGSPTLWKWGLLPLGIALLLFTFLWREPAFRETARYTLQGIALTPVFVCAISWPEFGPFRVVNTRVLSFLGVISYSLYLTHHLIIYGVKRHLPELHPVAQGGIAAVLAVSAAYLIYRSIERPAAKLRKRLHA